MDVSPEKNCVAALVSGLQLATLFITAALAASMTPESNPRVLVNSSLLPTSGQQISVLPLLNSSSEIAGFKPRKVKGPKGPTGGAGTRLMPYADFQWSNSQDPIG